MMLCISPGLGVSRTKLWMRLMLPSASPARLASSLCRSSTCVLQAGRCVLTTQTLAAAKNRIRTTSSRPSRQFMNRLSGSMMNRATKVREVLAEERQPDAEQVVDAGQHDLDQPAGMLGAVERERQHQHVLEEARHRAEPPAMGHAVGLQRDHDVGDDAAQADDGPQNRAARARRATAPRPACPWP